MLPCPRQEAIEAAQQISETCPSTSYFGINDSDASLMLLVSLTAGIAGYMSQNAPITKVISAVRLIHSGKTVCDSNVTEVI